MFCPKCGLQQPDFSNYCLRCGWDLSDKRAKYGEISAGAIPVNRASRQVPANELQLPLEADERHTMPPPPRQSKEKRTPTAARAPLSPAARRRRFLQHLVIRRLLCLISLFASLGLGAITWLTIDEELMAFFNYARLPSFNIRSVLALASIVVLGTLQALIGIGALYSRPALTFAFFLSVISAFLALFCIPGGWTVRLAVFGLYVLCALSEAVSAMDQRPATRRPATR